ncbi:MAG TPA: methyltransferase [Actinophytocola sp.]|uniref:methyltransferase n=1 Tax=Actinophytocola sp. TaxID=1872138 RepID=UPI002DDCD3F2|nr:methyltransferase [Actinophytocola sp.]HEV2780415.1 methyltransferase [Actinophytocola sp.]
MSSEKMRNRAALIERIGGYMTAHALGLAAELEIADRIHGGVCTSAELARETGTHEPSLRRLLRLLAAVGITTEPAPGRFGLTEIGDLLRSDSPDSLYAFTRMFCHESHFRAWLGLGHSVRTGESGWDHVFGANIYAYLADNPELSALFNQAMSQEARLSAGQIAAAYDFSDVTTVVDVGGGDGTLISAILRANPHLKGIVFDSPSGVAQADGVLADAGLADRAEAVAGDFFESIPANGDLYLIKSVFQDWDDEPAKAILRTCRAHMPPTATLLIVGSLLPERAAPGDPIMFFTDVNMLVNSGGRERTEAHFRTLLAETGFAVKSVALRAAGPLSIIETRPA